VVDPKVVFLPGALGAAAFWQPVGALLPERWEKRYLAWPGLGDEPRDADVNGFDDLVAIVERELDRPCDVVAQSMGGIVAVRAALRHPTRVRRLVLVATSGGVDVAGSDWRSGYRAANPTAARWITVDRPDHTAELPRVAQPTLLVWGDADPISPVAVGERLLQLLPDARLHVLPGGTHALAVERAPEVAALVADHLS
jgi:pimeloyl-ACP methyl ester carboxylesterase